MNLSVSPLLRRALPAVVAVAALAGGSALAPAAAPASAAANPAKFTWHNFKLLNGWQSASVPSLVTGTPGWAIHDNVLYLRGVVENVSASPASAVMGVLPQYARPAHDLYIQNFTAMGVPGRLWIQSRGGEIRVEGSNASSRSSLSAISFPLPGLKLTKAALENGWASDNSLYNTGDPAYAISDGVVHLSGSLTGGKVKWAAFTLPKAARPANNMWISVYTLAASTGIIEIEPNGKVIPRGDNAHGYTSLASISYAVAGSGWHNLKLTNGWAANKQYKTGAPQYTVINGIVYLRGGMYEAGSGTTGLWTAEPKAVRPADAVSAEVYTLDGTTGYLTLTNTFGVVASSPFSDAQSFTSLAAISYPASS